MSDYNTGKGPRRRRKKHVEKPAYQPMQNNYLQVGNQQRFAMPSMAPPRHLPTNIVPPPASVKVKKEPFKKAATAPAVALNTWKPPSNPNPPPHMSITQFTPSNKLPPAPPPSKPIVGKPTEFGLASLRSAKAAARPRKGPKFGVPLIKPPTESIVLPKSPAPPVTPRTLGADYTVGSSFDLIPPPGDRTGLNHIGRQGSNTSAGRRKRRRKKKRLNKFKSNEIQREPVNDVVFKPKPAPLPPVHKKPSFHKRGRANSKNASSAFYGLASKEPNDLRFDNAMQKMKIKMERKKSQQNLFTEPKATPRSREKSQQLQSKLQTQFGVFQNKFNHKQRAPRKQRRGQNRRGQPKPTLPPRKQQPFPPSNIAGLF